MSVRHALVTGGAGFIGSHLVDSLLADSWRVTVVDNFDPFYGAVIKEANLHAHATNPAFRLLRFDIRDAAALRAALTPGIDVVVHLAARPGVRPSIADPVGHQDVNVTGTQQMLELARDFGVGQFVFASSSSVYGVNPNVPWREDDSVLLPISPYASTKVSGELLGHVYAHLYGMRFVALRFFTVYGPRQRPDLAIHKFARCIREGQRLPVYGDGSTLRDYTYIDDIVRGIRAAMEYRDSPYEVINLGNHAPVTLAQLIEALERVFGKALIERLPTVPGDVPRTWASVDKARALLGWEPSTSLAVGLQRFAGWLADASVGAPESARG